MDNSSDEKLCEDLVLSTSSKISKQQCLDLIEKYTKGKAVGKAYSKVLLNLANNKDVPKTIKNKILKSKYVHPGIIHAACVSDSAPLDLSVVAEQAKKLSDNYVGYTDEEIARKIIKGYKECDNISVMSFVEYLMRADYPNTEFKSLFIAELDKFRLLHKVRLLSKLPKSYKEPQ